MMAAWMAYATLLGAAAIAVALGTEKVLRFYGRPARWAWAAGIAATLLLPVLLLLSGGAGPGSARPAGPESVAAPVTGSTAAPEAFFSHAYPAAFTAAPSAAAAFSPEPSLPTSGHTIAPAEPLSGRLGTALLFLWGVSALVLFLLAGRAALRLRRMRREWGRTFLDGTEVRLSARTGPAVAGVLRPEIVIPERMLEWDEEQRRLALRHEREHVRARDPLLLGLGFAAAALAPWNLPLWYLLRRLRLAVETDCDARVLAAAPDVRRYGALLLEAGRFHRPAGAGIVCFAESGSFLERRIRAMTTRPPARRALAAAGIALLCGSAAAAMAGVPVPPAPELRFPVEAGPAAPLTLPTVTVAAPEQPAAAPAALVGLPAVVPADTLLPSLLNPGEVSEELRRLYPAALSERGVGGIVMVEARIAADGRVLSTRVAQTSDRRFSQAALAAANAARFRPARHQGVPAESTVLLPLKFHPQGSPGTALVTPVSTATPQGPEATGLARAIYEQGSRIGEQQRGENAARARELYERVLEDVTRAQVQEEGARVREEGVRVQAEGARVQEEGARVREAATRVQQESVRVREEAERVRRARENGLELMRRNLAVIEAQGLQAAIGDRTRYVWLVQPHGRDQVLAAGIAAMPPAGRSWDAHDVRRYVESQVPGIQVTHTYIYAGMALDESGRTVNLAIISVRTGETAPQR
jgi:TonB family protein